MGGWVIKSDVGERKIKRKVQNKREKVKGNQDIGEN
jgi:hypothetical protein